MRRLFTRNPFVLKKILLKTAFGYFRDTWDKSIVCAKQAILKVDDAMPLIRVVSF